MSLAAGTRLGPYELQSALGAGGMGEVYRARDTRLQRDVALKVLPQAFAADSERLARFKREAQVLASLNHPNIAAIFGIEEDRALVLELVEGPTLADRIAQGPIPLDEALAIARQIADALEAAHEQGVIHRDLKPANIKVRADGTVKVLDFGLAKALDAGPSAALSVAPTITSPAMMTGVGVILGTAAYMAPEQARGKTVDKRADIWAFGCVLYEMLTGRPAFDGEDVAEILGAVIHKEPIWAALPSNLPPSIRTLVRRCLQKDPKQRVRDAGDVRLALDGAFESPAVSEGVGAAVATITAVRLWKRAAVIAVSIGVAAAGVAVWSVTRAAPAPVVKLTAAHSGPELVGGFETPDVDITPDGRRIVYFTSPAVGDPQRQLYVRALDQLTSSRIGDSGYLFGVFTSPDGQWVGFADGNTLKKISINGGPAVTISKIPANLDGASWGADGAIIFAIRAASDAVRGLWRVSSAGGNPERLTTPEEGRSRHLRPQILPGGRAVLFDSLPPNGTEGAQIVVLNLQTAEQKVLVQGGTTPRYAASGHLVYGVGGNLWAVAFDLDRLEVVGDAVPVVEGVARSGSGRLSFSLASNGTLVYRPGTNQNLRPRTLVWVDRQGREEAINAPPHAYTSLSLSPDGARVALDATDEQNDIWVWDLGRETLTRLTFDPGDNRSPVWTPDGRRLAFSAARDGAENIYWQAADGSGVMEPLIKQTRQLNRQLIPMTFSPDGSRLVFRGSGPPRDLDMVALNGNRDVSSLLQTPFNEVNAVISPDGRWLAYASDESGRSEVYVRPFPDANAGRWQVSTEGGVQPRWARNGRELFYLAPQRGIMGVPVQPGSSFATGSANVAVKGVEPVSGVERVYDVSPDGRRFLIIKEAASASEATASPQLVVVLNWDQELKRLVPAN